MQDDRRRDHGQQLVSQNACDPYRLREASEHALSSLLTDRFSPSDVVLDDVGHSMLYDKFQAHDGIQENECEMPMCHRMIGNYCKISFTKICGVVITEALRNSRLGAKKQSCSTIVEFFFKTQTTLNGKAYGDHRPTFQYLDGFKVS